jgi:hypothetical protein
MRCRSSAHLLGESGPGDDRGNRESRGESDTMMHDNLSKTMGRQRPKPLDRAG